MASGQTEGSKKKPKDKKEKGKEKKERPRKYEKPLKLDMSFDEALERIVKAKPEGKNRTKEH